VPRLRIARFAGKESSESAVQIAERLLEPNRIRIAQPWDEFAQARQFTRIAHIAESAGHQRAASGTRRKVRFLAEAQEVIPRPATGTSHFI